MDNANYLMVRLGRETALIDAASVGCVVELDAITPVPCAPPHVAGLAAMRSRPITVIDCYRSLELPTPEDRAVNLAVVVELEGHLYALLVDEVMDVIATDSPTVAARMQLNKGWSRVQRGLVETAAGPALVLDPLAMIAGPAAALAA